MSTLTTRTVKGSALTWAEVDANWNALNTDKVETSSLATGVATFLGAPSSANLLAALTDKTGTGLNVFATSPTLTTPNIGTPSAGVLTNCTALPLTTGVTGTLALTNGGTGQTTANAALNALLPSQATNSGKVLSTDGTNTSWIAASGSGTVTSVSGSGGTTGLTLTGGPITASGTLTLGGTLAVANGGTGVTTSTGTGNVVLSTSPTLTTPLLGTPTSGTLTNCTGLPVSTGISGLGTGIATFLATPTSANLIAAVTNETGSGSLVFATSPTLVTPVLGTPSSGTLTSCTGLPISTGVSGLGTGVATLLGTPTMANLVAAITGDTPVGRATTDTLTNKRVTQRVSTAASITSPWAWNGDSFDLFEATALANALTINADAGTPADGQRVIFRIKDNGTARALTWTTGASKAFRVVGQTLPTTTVISKVTMVGCIYNAGADRWDVVAVNQEV